MKITVLNGSPKGETSVTMQYINYIKKKFPRHEYVLRNISARIKKIEKMDSEFADIIEEVESSDGVIWATPVYTFFVPAQYMRFIELVNENNFAGAFKKKYATVITTSIHFYDHTAHRYMNAVCDDFNMHYTGFFSAEMNDLLSSSGRDELLMFASDYFGSIENNKKRQKYLQPMVTNNFVFSPNEVTDPVQTGGKKIIVLTDSNDENSNLGKMIRRFTDSFVGNIETINIRDIDIKGGCLGCIKCGYDNTCVYRDEFFSFYKSKVLTADIIIFACELKFRNFSSKWKEFFDRRFFMNHVPEMKGKQLGVIIAGPISQMPYLYDFYHGISEGLLMNANIAGLVKDECCDSDNINDSLQFLAENLVSYAKEGYVTSQTFLGIGGSKIFRDAVWGKLRFIFQADHKYFKNNGYYDFPQKKIKVRIVNTLFMLLTKLPPFRKELYKRIKTELIKPHQKVVDRY